jgi:hypothetical protein
MDQHRPITYCGRLGLTQQPYLSWIGRLWWRSNVSSHTVFSMLLKSLSVSINGSPTDFNIAPYQIQSLPVGQVNQVVMMFTGILDFSGLLMCVNFVKELALPWPPDAIDRCLDIADQSIDSYMHSNLGPNALRSMFIISLFFL